MILSSRANTAQHVWATLRTSDNSDGATVCFHVLPARGDTFTFIHTIYRVSDVAHEVQQVAGQHVQCIYLILEKKFQ